MSTIKASNIQNGSSSSVNIALNTDGSATFAQMPVGPSYFTNRNKIINGGMVIDQRNGGASVTPVNLQTTYIVDRFGIYVNQASKLTAQQNAGGVTPPVGFSNYLGVTSSSSYSSGAADIFVLYQTIEGFNAADLAFGTSNARQVTLSFWARSSITGTHSGALTNSGNNRSYAFQYTISVANTWEYKTITIPGDTTGTWLTNNGYGIGVKFNLGSGSNTLAASGTWVGSELNGSTGSVSLVGTNGATWYVTGVQLESGSVATPFERRIYQQELFAAQRYYQRITQPIMRGVMSSATSAGRIGIPYLVPMRTTPSFALIGTIDWFDGSGTGTITSASVVNAYPTTQGVDFDAGLSTGTSGTYRMCIIYVGPQTGSIALAAEF